MTPRALPRPLRTLGAELRHEAAEGHHPLRIAASGIKGGAGRAGKDCAGGFTEERAIARAKYLKVEPAKAPDFAAEADGVKAYRFTIRDVKEKSELYEYLTVVRSGSTTLAFRGEAISTKDIGGIPQDVMTAQWVKFRAS